MKKITLLFFNCIIFITVNSQINETYSFAQNYLYRMAQKGVINFNDNILPLSRSNISIALDSIKQHENLLSVIEKKELYFLQQEFYLDNHLNNAPTEKPVFAKKDKGNRWRLLGISTTNAQLFIDPLVTAEVSSFGNLYNIKTSGGARVYGNLGKHFAFNLAFRDVTERGDSIDYTKTFTAETGVLNTSRNVNQLNYSVLNFNLTYKFKNGLLSVGNDNINWGYGIGGKLILSSKSPTYPYIKLDYKPFKWLQFNYFHAWLNSNIIDSARSYYTGTGVAGNYRQFYVSKFLALHSISFIPYKHLEISIGESMMYSDKLDIGYLVPINIFKIYDQHISNYNLAAGSNSQIFAQISSRNFIKKTHAYLNVFIDELLASKMFNKKESRNQLGFTFGIITTDIPLKYFTCGAEYTRINPFVYNNVIPAQTYKHSSYMLGDWIGNNGDRLLLFANYTPIAKLKTNISLQLIRKGDEGTIDQQYNQQPQPQFLFGKLLKQNTISVSASYEFINKLNLYFKAISFNSLYEGKTENKKSVSLGISYGL